MGKACPFALHNLIEIWNFQNSINNIGPLTNFGLLFPVVCFVFGFDQTLVEHLSSDKVEY